MKCAGVGVVLLLGCCGTAAAAESACAASPAAAIEAHRSGVAAASQRGYRVEAVRWDGVQGQRWAVIRSCDHAERPTVAMLTDLPLLPAAGRLASAVAASSLPVAVTVAVMQATVPVIHAGEMVRLWRMDGMASIELVAVAEESGAIGSRVRVRLAKLRDANGQPVQVQQLKGIVRGAGDVEIEP